MFSHVMIGADDIDVAKRFYDAALGTLGVPEGTIDSRGRIAYSHAGGRLMVTKPINGDPACHANGGTIGFAATSPEAVDAWHAAGVAEGGKPCEDGPGWRQSPIGKLYLAYMRDPAGNKLCGLYRAPDA
ncbi:VOC family protein [Sphingomonas sp. AP4-R1]|uniref:VOC family protein n=1 Tax=Sphingomonas sp. AP4-R1 TaxID=2735134 RepID=UPI001493CA2F|nr:VOC family protein [Sphingomonas sp. AP4-R1]QJU57320.1 VOC family protein [Sphingomonas sp. AP4-R1]